MATIAQNFDDLARANQIAPVTQDFDESKGVAGRVNSIISSGSPLMETARTSAAQNSARRGLMNSSIGVQAGEQAVIETATPIANADANLSQQQNLTNQSARNTANIQNANNAIQSGAQGRTLMEQARIEDTRLGQNQAQFDVSSGLERDRLTQNQSQFEAQQGLTMQLAELEAKFKNEIQSSANISQAWSTLQQGIAQIQNNPELSPEAKQTMIESQLASFQAFSSFWQKATGGSVDVSDLLNFGVAPGAGGAAPAPAPGPGGSAPAPGNPYPNPSSRPPNPGAAPYYGGATAPGWYRMDDGSVQFFDPGQNFESAGGGE